MSDMIRYKAFWRAKTEFERLFPSEGREELFGYFTTTTEYSGKLTACTDINGHRGRTIRYKMPPAENDVDRKIAEIAVVDASEITAFVHSLGATSGLGSVDFEMPEDKAGTILKEIGSRYGEAVRFVEFDDYLLNGR